MNLQGFFDEQAIDRLPRVRLLIDNAPAFESNQMVCRTLREICNTIIPLAQKTEKQFKAFEDELIKTFKYHNWIK